MSAWKIVESPEGVTFDVRVIPRARRNAVDGVQGDALKVRLAAAPVDGAANEALIAFVAGQLGVRKSAVSIHSGAKSRHKTVYVEGIDRARVEQLLKR
jgi:uncharacterized protein (TIGR00251 family)